MWMALDRILKSGSMTVIPTDGMGSSPQSMILTTGQESSGVAVDSNTASIPMRRVWAMPNKWTFKIKPIRELLEEYKVGAGWIDPFAGFNSPAEWTNDLNPESPAKYHVPAHDFLSLLWSTQLEEDSALVYDGCLFDPPYSIHQVKVAYDSFGLSLKDNITGGFPKEKDLISRLVRPGGIVISFGWNTVGMGKKRGFEAVEYIAVSHGGNRNDTLVTVERKL